ncbi:DUF998 domain-containing protein [Actinokineospora bangkokensis]|uniref:DUF998 domain-containing protein n=1 Tax=Actinokineospora bangkokensis TaxID=1193682 RepID=A0A1Q9LNA8_9PSEU|nr:DUF998 domain-containing protein [Actinokineospora bangkokensis]OLR93537.1 hypothetical protein BJP25_14655 [Actinokineospora bangkokensis]
MASRPGFDGAAAVTRSLLGWGVVAPVFYLVFGLVLALTRPGFDLSKHALSLLTLGDGGWLQILNFVLTGLMVLAAAYGFWRALPRRATGALLAVYGVCLVLSGVFRPDPVGGFPPGAPEGASASGVLHLAFGGVGFLCLAAACFTAAGVVGAASRVAGVVVLLGFAGGAATGGAPVGVLLLWVAVVVGLGWLAFASVRAYRQVPHPVLARR